MTTEQKVTRKLSAILSADVKGYSLLMTNDEASTIQTLKEYRIIMSEIIKHHSGRVVDALGDNMLAEFSSVVNAVQCSVEVQKALKARNADLPDDKRLEFRIGVNIGDVVQDGDSLYGEGVNIAARIEGLSDPSGVCISRGAYDHVKNKLKLGYEFIGEHAVKNIKDPVRVYKVLMDPEDAGKLIGEEPRPLLKPGAWSAVIIAAVIFILIGYQLFQKMTTPEFEPASIEKMAYQLPDKPSIAVLAFENMSGDPEQEYFSDGITEEIITSLSKTDKLFVIARNSTFTYKNKPVKVKQVAEELGVRYVLEGSVRKSEDRVRITAQLIDAVAGHHLWAERYDRDIKDIFALQDEITMKIVTALRIKLTEGEQARMWAEKINNLDVYLKQMEALSLWAEGSKESIIRYGQVAQEVIDMAPESPLGYKFLAWYNWYLAISGKSPQESIGKAFKLAQKALSLDETDAYSHALLGSVYLSMRKYKKAIAAGERSIELDPNGAMVHGLLGVTLGYAGRLDEAIGYLKQGIRLNPFPDYWYFYRLGHCYRQKGQYEEALTEFKKALHRSPDALPNHTSLASIYALLNRQEEASATAKKVLDINPNYSVESANAYPYKNQADLKLFIDSLRKAGLPDKPPVQLPDKPSIAVLPFDNMSDDPQQEYFSDGITEDIITTLSKTDQLLVIARNSTFTYKGKPVKIKQVAEELGVRYVLEGSVRKVGDKVRITAQLIDAKTGHHLWAERYDRDLKDIFAIQDEITMKIVTALGIKLTGGEQVRIWAKGIDRIDVFLKSIEADSLWNKGTNEAFIRYGQVGQEIIDMAPESYLGYNTLAWYHWWLAMQGKSPQESVAKAFELTQKALSIDESNPAIHTLLGSIYLLMRQYEKAIAAGKQSVALDPNGALSHAVLGGTLCYADRQDEALVHLKQSIRLNPLPAHWYFLELGRCYRQKGQYEEALTAYKKALHLNPNTILIHQSLAIIYILLDQQMEAEGAAKKILEINPNYSVKVASKAWPYKNQTTIELITDALRKAGLPD